MSSYLQKFGPALAAAFCVAAIPVGAQKIPAAAPTSAPQPVAAPQPPPPPIVPAPAAPPPAPVTRARVDFTNQLLTISADNSSLNQILRDLSQITGMTITGGVNEERVFGNYGPADMSTVLTDLLNGTGSNILIAFDAKHAPRELILTPRMGGPTPPNPNAVRDANRYNDVPQQQPRMFNRDNPPEIQQQQMQPPPQMPPPQVAPAATPASSPAASTTTDTTQQSPNGVRTPQQIYEDLMKMNQQKATPPPL